MCMSSSVEYSSTFKAWRNVKQVVHFQAAQGTAQLRHSSRPICIQALGLSAE